MATNQPIVVLTGAGWVCPWGNGPGAGCVLAAPEPAPTRAADGRWLVSDADLGPDPRKVAPAGGDRAALLAGPALRHAAADARLDFAQADATRIGLVLGSAFAALADMMQFAGEVIEQSPRFVSPLHFPHTVGNYAAGAVARLVKINGPNLTIGHGPEAGILAVQEAASLLVAGTADVMFAGGVDTIDPALLPGLVEAGRVALHGPFASQPAEAACILCLETLEHARARGAKVFAAIAKPDPAPARAVWSLDLCGHADKDQPVLESIRAQAASAGEAARIISARHLVGSAFSAAAAGQVALAAHALAGVGVAGWEAARSSQSSRELNCADWGESDAALVVGPSALSIPGPSVRLART